MIKKPFLATAAILLYSVVQPISASTITLVNHFPYPMKFVVENNNYIPNFSEQFTLEPGSQVQSSVLTSGHECDSAPYGSPAAYLQGTIGDNARPLDVFFGVGRECGPEKNPDSLVQVSGFNDTGIAYSWIDKENVTVTFCLPEEYSKNGNKCV